MKTIYFIRHAESDYNILWDVIGWQSNHINLTEKWERQASLLWEYLLNKWIKFDKVYSSIAVRARKTAEISLSKINFPLESIIPRDDILELSQWDWEWISRSQTYTPEMLEKIRSDNWNFKAPNWESQRDVEERMLKFLKNELMETQEWGIFAVYTHWLAIKCMLRWILDSNPSLTYYISIDNTAMTKLTIDWEIISLWFLNYVPHL